MAEVFSAIQGEGAHVGRRQVFLRLAGCNIRCLYCDQPEALELRPGPCRIEQRAGRRDWSVRSSPLEDNEVVAAVVSLWDQLTHHSISVTGGEPLMQSERLARIMPALKGPGRRIHLETNGTLGRALARVLPWLDEVSMDLKLPSVDGEGVGPAAQSAFMAAVVGAGVALSAKIVLGAGTDEAELVAAVKAVAAIAPAAGVFLQPVTPFGAVTEAPSPEQVLGWQELALAHHHDVRVIPQTHKQIGQL
ncbi:MAG TPA: 7-carboxy-7-deazaguanine synthase QueE [Acidimicrobiales bacterium]|nr:7-carboxy-7-deazaguanine synthase QueE [Acidimicrobiales bacterium]